MDVESIVVKIYSYFYIYTVRNNEFKKFCNEASEVYKKVLGYSKIRWLELLPAVKQILSRKSTNLFIQFFF